MSAPQSHDPLVVNTQDGHCWTRRAVTRQGRGLYALAGSVAGAPDEVLATLADLAEHGLVSTADVLPMPAGPSVEASADKLTRLLAPTQALREERYESPLRHDYRVSRDLPETGGA